MRLFDESKNYTFQRLYALLRDMSTHPEGYTEQEICQRLSVESPTEDFRQFTVEVMKQFFKKNPATGRLLPRMPLTLPPMPQSELERRWLQNLVQDTDFAFLLRPELRRTLADQLGSTPPLVPAGSWKKRSMQQACTETQQHLLRAYYESLLAARCITYTTRDGAAVTAAPCRLEYNIATGAYALLVWPGGSPEPTRVLLPAVTAIQPTNQPIPADQEQRLQGYYEHHRQTLTLQVKKEKNAIERCFAIFFMYNKEAEVSEDQQTYTLHIQYYDFDRADVIRYILSLGSSAVVVSPPDMRSEIYHIWQETAKRYSQPY